MPPATRRLLLATLGALVCLPAAAQMGGPAAPISALNDALLQIMHAGIKTPFDARSKIMSPAVEGAFDLSQIVQTSVGPRWSALPEKQQSQLLEVFTAYTVASYVANFNSFGGERFAILPETRQVGNDQVVQSRIMPKSGDAIRIDYVMRQTETGWKAIDVLLDGSISRVAVQRSDFRKLLSGGDAGKLIASLRKKTATLQAGGKP